MQYRLRTLLIALAVMPPLLAGALWAWPLVLYFGMILLAALVLLLLALSAAVIIGSLLG